MAGSTARAARLVICALVPALAFTWGDPARAQSSTVAGTIEGYARVKDGDGVLFGKVEIRLQGIAAPEDNWRTQDPGGQEATANLAQLIEGVKIICELDGTMAGKRPVGVCFVNGKDVGAAQVEGGFARDCPHFSKGRYAKLEAKAKSIRDLSLIYPLPGYC